MGFADETVVNNWETWVERLKREEVVCAELYIQALERGRADYVEYIEEEYAEEPDPFESDLDWEMRRRIGQLNHDELQSLDRLLCKKHQSFERLMSFEELDRALHRRSELQRAVAWRAECWRNRQICIRERARYGAPELEDGESERDDSGEESANGSDSADEIDSGETDDEGKRDYQLTDYPGDDYPSFPASVPLLPLQCHLCRLLVCGSCARHHLGGICQRPVGAGPHDDVEHGRSSPKPRTGPRPSALTLIGDCEKDPTIFRKVARRVDWWLERIDKYAVHDNEAALMLVEAQTADETWMSSRISTRVTSSPWVSTGS